jgi:hypothetical protein
MPSSRKVIKGLLSIDHKSKKKNASHESRRKNQNIFCFHYIFPENRAFYEIMWKK